MMQTLNAVVGIDQVLFGSDFLPDVEKCPTSDQPGAVLGINAPKLFPRLAAIASKAMYGPVTC
jgi:hypothetical protein